MKENRLWKAIKNPPTWLYVLWLVLSIIVITTTLVLLGVGDDSFIMYILYGLSAVFLTYAVYIVIYISPKLKNNIITAMKKHSFTNNLLTSYGYRTSVFTIISFFINFVYAIFMGIMGVAGSSIWFGALAAYYIFLCFTRGYVLANGYQVVKGKKKQKDTTLRQLKTYRNSGISMLIINLSLSAAVILLMLNIGVYKYQGLIIYFVAVYTTYKVTMSIINIVKATKQDNYIIKAIRCIGFADSLVSLYALQSALIAQFSQGVSMQGMNIAVGVIIVLLTLILSIYMIASANKKLKEFTNEKERQI